MAVDARLAQQDVQEEDSEVTDIIRAMRTLLCLVCLAVAAPATAQSPAANTADEAAVRDIVRRYTAARELNEPKAIEALFTADADQYTSSGEWRRGMSALIKGMQETSARNPGVRAINVAAVRFITPDVAIVDGEYKTGTDGRLLWTTLTVKRDGKNWRIAAIRNMAPTAPTR